MILPRIFRACCRHWHIDSFEATPLPPSKSSALFHRRCTPLPRMLPTLPPTVQSLDTDPTQSSTTTTITPTGDNDVNDDHGVNNKKRATLVHHCLASCRRYPSLWNRFRPTLHHHHYHEDDDNNADADSNDDTSTTHRWTGPPFPVVQNLTCRTEPFMPRILRTRCQAENRHNVSSTLLLYVRTLMTSCCNFRFKLLLYIRTYVR